MKLKEILLIISSYANEHNWDGNTWVGPGLGNTRAKEFMDKIIKELEFKKMKNASDTNTMQLELFKEN